MTNTYLNLEIHSIDEIQGKIVEINGVKYEFLELMGEGGESFVYPLRNTLTKCTHYVGKIFKYKAGTPQYLDKMNNHYKANFVLISENFIAAHTEYYEKAGGLIIFQESFAGVVEKEYYKDLMEKANELKENGDIEKSINAYESILRLNPFHNYALLNLASTHAEIGNIPEALDYAGKAIEYEPNCVKAYHMIANIQASINLPELSMYYLMKTLKRYNLDFPTIKLAIGYAEIIGDLKFLNETYTFFKENLKLEKIETEITEKIKSVSVKNVKFDSLLNESFANMNKQNWDMASKLLKNALLERSTRNCLFNFTICQFHLKNYEYLVSNGYFLIGVLNKVEEYSLLLQLLISNYYLKLYDNSIACSILLNENIAHTIDLPGIPGFSMNGNMIENTKDKQILNILKVLTTKTHDQSKLNGVLNLSQKYKDYFELYENNPENKSLLPTMCKTAIASIRRLLRLH